MDGFEGNTGVIILAATNRPESLDPALTRPGRFDRRVPVELPDLKGREEILKVHAKKVKAAEDVDFAKIARMASGASGAELANIVNEAALRAVRSGRSLVTQSDLEESIEVVIAGYQKKNAILTDREKQIVAYHEVGHALVAAMQTHSAPVQKITIVPRTSGALGYTMQVEEGNHYLMSQEELENKIATLTGGRAAEELVFQSASTGASNDIEQATKLARAMITRYGMSGTFDMVALESVNNQYLGETPAWPAPGRPRPRSTGRWWIWSDGSTRRPPKSWRTTAGSWTRSPSTSTSGRPSPERSSWLCSTHKTHRQMDRTPALRRGVRFFSGENPVSAGAVCGESPGSAAGARPAGPRPAHLRPPPPWRCPRSWENGCRRAHPW